MNIDEERGKEPEKRGEPAQKGNDPVGSFRSSPPEIKNLEPPASVGAGASQTSHPSAIKAESETAISRHAATEELTPRELQRDRLLSLLLPPAGFGLLAGVLVAQSFETGMLEPGIVGVAIIAAGALGTYETWRRRQL
jgi:hypothetical protein